MAHRAVFSPIRAAWLAVAISIFTAPGTSAEEPAAAPRVDLYGDPLPKGAIARIGTERYHGLRLSYGSLTPDEKTLVCCGKHGAVHFVEAFTGKEIARLGLGGRKAVSVAVSFDGTQFAVSSERDHRDPRISVFDFTTHAKLFELPLPKKCLNVSADFSLDGKRLVTSHWERTRQRPAYYFRVYSAEPSGRLLHETLVKEPFAYNRAAETLVWVDREEGHAAHLWDVKRWQRAGLWKLTGHGTDEEADCLAISDDAKRLAVAWKPWPHGLPERGGSPSDPTPADYTIDVIDVETRRVARNFRGDGHAVQALVMLRGGGCLAAGHADFFSLIPTHTRIWNLWAPADVSEMWFSPIRTATPAFFTRSGNYLFAGGRDAVQAWDLRKRRPSIDAPANSIVSLDVSADGCAIATAEEEGTLRLWDPSTGNERWNTGEGEFRASAPMAIVAGGALVATVGNWRRSEAAGGAFLETVDSATGIIRDVIPLRGERVTGIASPRKGSLFAVACELPGRPGEYVIRILDAAPLRHRRDISNPSGRLLESLKFSEDGRMLAIACRQLRSYSLRVISTDSGEELADIPARNVLLPLGFDGDARTLAVKRETRKPHGVVDVALYDTPTWQVKRRLGPIQGVLLAGAFSAAPSGKLVVSSQAASGALEVSFWDCDSGARISTKRVGTFDEPLRAVAYADRFLAVLSSVRSSVLVYPLPVSSERSNSRVTTR